MTGIRVRAPVNKSHKPKPDDGINKANQLDKENILPNMADLIKTRRRAATKMYTSPSKPLRDASNPQQSVLDQADTTHSKPTMKRKRTISQNPGHPSTKQRRPSSAAAEARHHKVEHKHTSGTATPSEAETILPAPSIGLKLVRSIDELHSGNPLARVTPSAEISYQPNDALNSFAMPAGNPPNLERYANAGVNPAESNMHARLVGVPSRPSATNALPGTIQPAPSMFASDTHPAYTRDTYINPGLGQFETAHKAMEEEDAQMKQAFQTFSRQTHHAQASQLFVSEELPRSASYSPANFPAGVGTQTITSSSTFDVSSTGSDDVVVEQLVGSFNDPTMIDGTPVQDRFDRSSLQTLVESDSVERSLGSSSIRSGSNNVSGTVQKWPKEFSKAESTTLHLSALKSTSRPQQQSYLAHHATDTYRGFAVNHADQPDLRDSPSSSAVDTPHLSDVSLVDGSTDHPEVRNYLQNVDHRFAAVQFDHNIIAKDISRHSRAVIEGHHLSKADLAEPETSAPANASEEDETFVKQVLAAVKSQGKRKTASVGRMQAQRIEKVLSRATHPNSSEALFVSGAEAAEQLKAGVYFPGVIITQDQQTLPLQTTTQFLSEYYDGEAKVYIQNPERLTRDSAVKEISIGEVKKRFEQPLKSRLPWNCLELATHVDDGLRPAFLNGEDCRLLTKLKLPSTKDNVSRRQYDRGWKEVEKWALLAQAGALTEPHQDSHGYSTFITINQGIFGFGWLANPSQEQREEWLNDPFAFNDGPWRRVVLRAGQTVFFPCGTVHFVFRLPSAGDTLAFGGHVLRCSQIVRWVKTMLQEQENPTITNEDLTDSARGYLERVETFVKQALKKGEADKWGGEESIGEFLKLKREYLSKST